MQGDNILSEILGYYKYKVDNNLCTQEEIKNAEKALMENMEVYGSIKDFAEYFDKPEVNIRVAINQKLIAKPKRVVLYPFHQLLKVVPDKWRKRQK